MKLYSYTTFQNAVLYNENSWFNAQQSELKAIKSNIRRKESIKKFIKQIKSMRKLFKK